MWWCSLLAASSLRTLPGITRFLSEQWRTRKRTRASRCFIFVGSTGASRATPRELFFVESSLSRRNVYFVKGSLPFGIAGRPRRFRRIAQLLAMALHFAQRVDRLVLRFVVGARNDLAEQSHGDKLHPAHQDRHRYHHYPPRFPTHRLVHDTFSL